MRILTNIAKTILKESSLTRIWKHVTEHDSGTITAFRYGSDCGEGQRHTTSENRQRNGQLKSKLLSMGYGVTAINGVYIENYGTATARPVKEESFIVVDLKDTGNLKRDLIKLGNYFEQDSITYSKPNGEYYLISTNDCPHGYPGNGSVGKEVRLGKPLFGKSGEFHSTVRGRPFVFEGINPNLSILTDYPITEIRSFIMNAKKINLD